ncbi:hypothetical protein J9238_01025 [Providencia rettgeri]|nr:hypothetical protein [Providencia rettgeri]
MGVHRYCCSSPECIHSRFFCQACKSKAYSAYALKGTEQWIAQQRHILPDCEWPPSLYLTYLGFSSTIIDHCSISSFVVQPVLC